MGMAEVLTPEQIADRMLAEAGIGPADELGTAGRAAHESVFGEIDWREATDARSDLEERFFAEPPIAEQPRAASEPSPGQWGPIEPVPIERKAALLDSLRQRGRGLLPTNPGLILALPFAVALAIFVARVPVTPSVSVHPPIVTVVSPPPHAPSRAGGERRRAAATRTATRHSRRRSARGAESDPAAPSKSSGGRVSRLSPRGSVPPPDADATVEFLP